MKYFTSLLFFCLCSCQVPSESNKLLHEMDANQKLVFKKPVQVRAYRISPAISKSVLQVDDYAILRRSEILKGAVCCDISSILSSIQVESQLKSKEIFVPTILFKVKNESVTVKVYIDIDANKIQVKSGTSVKTLDILPSQSKLMAVLHQIFPFDDRFE